MKRIYVHDFSFDYVKLDETSEEKDFFCGIRIYYNFSPDQPGPGFDDLEYFLISVATPLGLSSYLKRGIEKKIYPSTFFFPNLLIVENWDEDEIMNYLKDELQSIYGKNEKEIILKAMKNFGWEHENSQELYKD